MSFRTKRVLQFAAAAVLSTVMLGGLAVAAYRAYSPGTLAERLERAVRRWAPFAQWETWRFLLIGFRKTLELAVISVTLSLVFAVVLALIRLSGSRQAGTRSVVARIARAPVAWLVEIVRSVPLFMLIIYMFIGMPRLGIDLSPFTAGVAALTLYTSAVLSEVVRAGILSLERGQFEAAEAMGLSYRQRLRYVILPQALRRMVPAIVSQLVTLIKDTSLVSFITVVELARRAQILQQVRFNPIETYLVVMAMYFVVNFILSELSRRLELRPGGQRAPVLVGEEDQVVV